METFALQKSLFESKSISYADDHGKELLLRVKRGLSIAGLPYPAHNHKSQLLNELCSGFYFSICVSSPGGKTERLSYRVKLWLLGCHVGSLWDLRAHWKCRQSLY